MRQKLPRRKSEWERQVGRDAPQLPNPELLGILPKPHCAPARRARIAHTRVLGAKDQGRVPGLYSHYTTKASA